MHYCYTQSHSILGLNKKLEDSKVVLSNPYWISEQDSSGFDFISHFVGLMLTDLGLKEAGMACRVDLYLEVDCNLDLH